MGRDFCTLPGKRQGKNTLAKVAIKENGPFAEKWPLTRAAPSPVSPASNHATAGQTAAKSKRVRVAMRIPDQARDGQHVVCDRVIDVPEIHRVPSAVFLGVVPGQQKICDAAGLAGVLAGDP